MFAVWFLSRADKVWGLARFVYRTLRTSEATNSNHETISNDIKDVKRKFIHHHLVGVVGRATSREIPGGVDMDTFPASGGAGNVSISTSSGVSREVARPTTPKQTAKGEPPSTPKQTETSAIILSSNQTKKYKL